MVRRRDSYARDWRGPGVSELQGQVTVRSNILRVFGHRSNIKIQT